MVFLKLDYGSVSEFINISSINRIKSNLEGTAILIELCNGNSTTYPVARDQDYELCRAVAEDIAKIAAIIRNRYPPDLYYWYLKQRIIDLNEIVELKKLTVSKPEARRQRGVSDINSPVFNPPSLETHTLSLESRSGESGPQEEELPTEQLEALEEHWSREYEEQVEETGTTVCEGKDGQPVEWNVEEVKKEEPENIDTRILEGAISILSQEDGLTPGEICKRLLENGIFTNPYRLGRLLTKSGKAKKRGSRWYLKESEETEIEQPEQPNEERKEEYKSEENLMWIEHGSYRYAIDQENDRIHLRIGNTNWARSLPYSRVKELYEKLPDEARTKDIIRIGRELGLKVNRDTAQILMHVFSNYVDFDAELIDTGRGRGKGLRLVKNSDFSLREDVRQKLKQELEVIGSSPEGGFDVNIS